MRIFHSIVAVLVFVLRCIVLVLHMLWNRCVPFRASSVYLRGFSCTALPDDWTVSSERFRRTALQNFGLEDKGVEFCMKLLARSGLGEQTVRHTRTQTDTQANTDAHTHSSRSECSSENNFIRAEHSGFANSSSSFSLFPLCSSLASLCQYFPPGLLSYPPDLSMQSARSEAEFVFCNALDSLFASTGIKPRDVDILIVNCSLFAPTPSLAAMIMNKYKMREDVDSYNLSGMVGIERKHEQTHAQTTHSHRASERLCAHF